MVRTELAADDSLAEMRARNKFGMAMAAIIRIIATTIKSSIRENPACDGILRIGLWPCIPGFMVAISWPMLRCKVLFFKQLEYNNLKWN